MSSASTSKSTNVIKKHQSSGAIGIVVSGGPAPGINGVISSTVYAAHARGIRVKGLKGGFRGIANGDNNAVIDLSPSSLSGGIYKTGGSILGTSRFNPLSQPKTQQTFIKTLADHNIDKLVIIGGEGSAWVSYHLSSTVPDIQVVHVPKTIDNDLILPNEYPSFGFETARYVGTNILHTLKVDARTSQRWFIVSSMGRKAGFLALGLGIASGATLTIIPEEFTGTRPTVDDIVDILLSSIKKRVAVGRPYGVAVIAEGVLDVVDPDSSELLRSIQRDELGRIRYNMLEIGDVIAPALRERCQQQSIDIKINTKNIGYELRCHEPVSFDIEYTTFLGYGAVRLLCEGYSGVMVTRDYDTLSYQNLHDMVGEDGNIKSRTVNLNSDLYQVALDFMTR
jgi:6-phosphofructokinase